MYKSSAVEFMLIGREGPGTWQVLSQADSFWGPLGDRKIYEMKCRSELVVFRLCDDMLGLPNGPVICEYVCPPFEPAPRVSLLLYSTTTLQFCSALSSSP